MHVGLGSKYASVAGLSAYKDIFLGILWNVWNILSVEQLWATFSKLFLKTLSMFFCICSWSILFLVWSHFICHLSKINICKLEFQKKLFRGKIFYLKFLKSFSSILKKKGNLTNIKCKNYLQNFWKFLSWMLEFFRKACVHYFLSNFYFFIKW